MTKKSLNMDDIFDSEFEQLKSIEKGRNIKFIHGEIGKISGDEVLIRMVVKIFEFPLRIMERDLMKNIQTSCFQFFKGCTAAVNLREAVSGLHSKKSNAKAWGSLSQ